MFDIPGRSSSPYQYNILFAAAPVRSFAPTNQVSFIFPSSLYLSNFGAPFSAPQIDFGDGRGYQQSAWDRSISTTYATAGSKRVRVRVINPWSGSSLESWFDFNVLSLSGSTAALKPGFALSTPNSAASDVEVPFWPAAFHSGGTAFIIYGSSPAGVKHTQLTKPFIISEGYNLYSVAPELRECNNPNNTIDDFFDKIDVRFFDAQGNVTGNFRTNLLNAGYDIVYIDNANGSDNIVRNARLFEDVVNWVNDNKVGGRATGEQNVVMGQSMGGLVARYGLALMNRYTGDAHTRLLLLHDSPQRGANNPVGVQSLTRSLDVPFIFGQSVADLSGQARAAVRVLNQPASQQLSILNAFNGRGGIQPNTFIDGDYQQMVDYSASYPIVAVSNGSQCGRGPATPAGVTITSSELAVLIPIPVVGLAGISGNLAAYGLPAYGQQAIISRVNIRLEYRIRIGICPLCLSIPIRFNLLRESAISPPNTLPYETLPGGTTNPAQQAGGCAGGFDFGSLNGIYAAYLRTRLYNGDLCFVPSYSALDVPTATPATAFAKYINNITDSPSLPRVARYIAQENVNGSATQFNVAHISFTPRNSEWIFREMQNTQAQRVCTPADNECSPVQLSISGGSAICVGGSTFTIVGQPAGATVTWTVTSAGGISPATGTGSSFTASYAGSTAAHVQLQATVSSGCGQYTVSKRVGVGTALSVSQVPDSRCGMVAQARTIGYDNVVWLVNGIEYPFSNVEDGVREFFEYQSGRVTVALRGTNTCNGAIVTSRSTTKTGPDTGDRLCTDRRAPVITLSPNPAREFVTVQVANVDLAQPITVRLFNSYGRLRLEETSTGKDKIRVRLLALPAGLYLVHVVQNQQLLGSEQLQVEN